MGSLFIVTACADTQAVAPVTKYTVAVESPEQILPTPDQLKLRILDWKVLKYDETTYFALDSDNYKKHAMNMNDIRAYMQQVNSIMENR